VGTPSTCALSPRPSDSGASAGMAALWSTWVPHDCTAITAVQPRYGSGSTVANAGTHSAARSRSTPCSLPQCPLAAALFDPAHNLMCHLVFWMMMNVLLKMYFRIVLQKCPLAAACLHRLLCHQVCWMMRNVLLKMYFRNVLMAPPCLPRHTVSHATLCFGW
jgi:hypothetical protein